MQRLQKVTQEQRATTVPVRLMEETVGTVTALVPVIGYDKATELADEAYKSGKGLLQLVREKKVLTEAQIKDVLDPAKLTNLNKSQYQRSARRGGQRTR